MKSRYLNSTFQVFLAFCLNLLLCVAWTVITIGLSFGLIWKQPISTIGQWSCAHKSIDLYSMPPYSWNFLCSQDVRVCTHLLRNSANVSQQIVKYAGLAAAALHLGIFLTVIAYIFSGRKNKGFQSYSKVQPKMSDFGLGPKRRQTIKEFILRKK